MKIKTLRSSKDYTWHKHFLWIPKKVRLTDSKDKVDSYSVKDIPYEYSILWLETVERINKSDISFDLDDWKYLYWKQL